jgi:hypothetical protein
MNRIYTLIFLSLITHLSQGQYLKMATFASSGGGVSPLGNYVSQVLGQSSLISGTAVSEGVVFRQGFKQPFVLLKTKKVYQEESRWSFEVFPNPFVDRLTIRFDRPTANPVILQVYDIQGKVLWQGDYPEKIEVINLEKFQDIAAGKYILQVFQKGKPISQSIIKQIN